MGIYHQQDDIIIGPLEPIQMILGFRLTKSEGGIDLYIYVYIYTVYIYICMSIVGLEPKNRDE